MKLEKKRIDRIIRFSLKEDIGTGDVTSRSTVNALFMADAVIVSRQEAIVCGIDIMERIFACVDCTLKFRPSVKDGEKIYPGQEIAFVEGSASSIMKAERTALNYLAMLSGVATETSLVLEKVKNTKVKICDTRKTVPLNRHFQKYAVVCGGGTSHRMGLWDMVLIKDNHIRAYSMQTRCTDNEKVIRDIIRRARKDTQDNIPVEIEVENLKECRWALEEHPDIVLLDNFTPEKVKEAVELRRDMNVSGVLLEASGEINLHNVYEYAISGVDRISMGSLTSRIIPINFSLQLIYRHG